MITFPCCLSCRVYINGRLRDAEAEMELDDMVGKKLIAVGLIEDNRMNTRRLDDTDVSKRHHYEFHPSAKSKQIIASVEKKVEGLSVETVANLLNLLGK